MMFTWVLFLAGEAPCFATSVVLQWDPDTSPGLAGYKVYYQADSSRQPYSGTGAAQGAAPVDVRNKTTATISGLDSANAYYFAVTAYDSSGVESAYSNIVNVPELVPPSISLSSPARNATVGGTVTISASAFDNVGVSKVEFYENGLLLSATNVTPYSFNWNTTSVANGSYTLTAKAYDATGNVGQSGDVPIIVSNYGGPDSTIAGDLNGDGKVDIADALLGLQIAVGLVPPSSYQLLCGDVGPVINGKSVPDGKIDLQDALAVLRVATGLTTL